MDLNRQKRRRRTPVPRQRMATLRDVAKVAGVSAMTVSNVVNGRLGVVRQETRDRVESAIRTLSYRPHTIGRSLRQARSFTIGLLILDETRSFLTDPFIAQITAGLSGALGERGYGLLLHGVPAHQLDELIFLRNARTDGLCLFLSGTNPQRRRVIDTLTRMEEPLVIFQETEVPRTQDYCIVRQADFDGGAMIAGHMLERGARRLAIFGPDVVWPGATQRLSGMIQTLKKTEHRGVKYTLLNCRDHPNDVEGALDRFIDKNGAPDAILAVNDRMGLGALAAVLKRGLKVPEDVKVSGYNAFDLWPYVKPMLTTIESGAYEMGRVAADAMVKRLESGRFRKHEFVLPTKLRVGNTS
jgi:LacI family transcriptional regulator